jgi:hypothetical protein
MLVTRRVLGAASTSLRLLGGPFGLPSSGSKIKNSERICGHILLLLGIDIIGRQLMRLPSLANHLCEKDQEDKSKSRYAKKQNAKEGALHT